MKTRRRQKTNTTVAPRSPVALALGARRVSGGMGRHGPVRGGRRLIERRELQLWLFDR